MVVRLYKKSKGLVECCKKKGLVEVTVCETFLYKEWKNQQRSQTKALPEAVVGVARSDRM